MRITIRHRTAYAFDAPVFLEPHIIRMRPRIDGSIQLLDFALDIDPAPVVRSENLDPEGNIVTRAWFEGTTSHLKLEARGVVDTLVTDPFQFLIVEPDRPLPYAYPPDFADRLALYRRPPDAAHPSVRQMALDAANEAQRNPAGFPPALARRINRDFTLELRPAGPPYLPESTIATRRGACRDVAVLFIACCRAMGLAARFASGYAYTGGASELHAWGEVFLRGGGWRGYDPSQGLAVADRHVTLAASANPRNAAPVTGTFRGDDVAADFSTEVALHADG